MARHRKPRSLTARDLQPVVARLRRANSEVARACPGERGDRQPVHTYYTGAHLFDAEMPSKLATLALGALDAYAPDGATFADALRLDTGQRDAMALAALIRARVVEKLRREPVEDLRLDFEDGYGTRPDAEEDGHAQSSAEEVARSIEAGTLPPFIGIRIKPMSNELHQRSLQTLDLFVTTLARAMGNRLPPNFVVTIPKVMAPGHVATVARVCGAIERRLRLRAGTIKIEVMIETPQSILSIDGSSALRGLVAAGRGRVIGAHFGTYDYTTLCGISAAWQRMGHAACDFARHMMQVSLAQTGVWLSDGGTNILPVGPHRAAEGRALTARQRNENREAVHRAWQLHFDDVRHSLVNGYYQGWDLHPLQLPTRYAAVYAFFQSARPAATMRLRSFVEKASQATLVSNVFDDAATGQGLMNFFVRGFSCGALTLKEAAETGLSRDELQSRSFLKVIERRAGRAIP